MKRKPTESEFRLLRELARSASESCETSWLVGLLVEAMDDEGMGSLKLLVEGADSARETTVQIAECVFEDSDGVVVVCTLLADETSRVPFELDVWKVDFSPLEEIPMEIHAVPLTSPSSA